KDAVSAEARDFVPVELSGRRPHRSGVAGRRRIRSPCGEQGERLAALRAVPQKAGLGVRDAERCPTIGVRTLDLDWHRSNLRRKAPGEELVESWRAAPRRGTQQRAGKPRTRAEESGIWAG